ncbi:hypothetical protein ACHQM5_008864 [Ranunculus cassubicifolius]
MEFITVITTLCIFLSIAFTSPCVSSLETGIGSAVTAKLPRKLIPTKDALAAKAYVSQAFIPDANSKATLPGRTPQTRHVKLDGRDGTRQKWVEGHMWQYFTMDYSRVRRRRPIHNKSIPNGP